METTPGLPFNTRKRSTNRMRKRRKTYVGVDDEADSTADLVASEKDVDHVACAVHVGERLSKLEQLFEKFACRKAGPKDAPIRARRQTAPKHVDDLHSVPSKHAASVDDACSLMGGGMLPENDWTSAPAWNTSEGRPVSEQSVDVVHRTLAALLPSQHDANVIFEWSNGWMILGGMYKPSKDIFVSQDPDTYALDMLAVAQEHSTIIARTLVHLAICISTLPPSFDAGRLENIWSLDGAMDTYIFTVCSLVTSSDEALLALPGLETLALLAVYHMNTANLRQAWLIVRRAINMAHLMGFDKIVEKLSSEPRIQALQAAAGIWRTFVDLDRCLSLHLRLPFGTAEYPVGEDASPHLIHKSRIAMLCRQISQLDAEITPQTYSHALALDEQLETLMKEHPKEFWEVPNVPSTARTAESLAVLERLIVHMWHFELKIMIHLPFLLRAADDPRYEFSKVTALQASRNIMLRWFALRNAAITQACCRFGELAVFVAGVTLLLDIHIDLSRMDRTVVKKNKGSDFIMVCRMATEMEKLGKASSRERLAARSAVVLKKLLCLLDPANRAPGRAQLTIPYFGRIQMDFGQPPLRPVFDLDSDTAKKLASTPTGLHLPVFSFVTNALWPLKEADTSGKQQCKDFDIILYDGLQDQDVEGNWVF